MSEKINIELELDADLFRWFEEYCADGLLEIDEELSTVAAQYIDEQLEEAGDPAEDRIGFDEEEDSEEFGEYADDEKEN